MGATIADLNSNVLTLFTNKMAYPFSKEEVSYAAKPSHILNMLIGPGRHLKGRVVILRPAIKNMPVQKIKNVNFQGHKAFEMTADQLEGFCSINPKIILYYQPVLPFGF